MSSIKEDRTPKSSELIAYDGQDPFVFVSYSHDQVVKVEAVLRLLQRRGIRFWYDKLGASIEAGAEWKKKINNRLEHCSMFLCFLANGVEQRPEVLDEIRNAIMRQEKEETFRVVFIFLEKMPAKVFKRNNAPEIEEYINRAQYISYHGITETFLGQLFAKDVFPDSLVAEEYLDAWKRREFGEYVREVNEAFVDNPYVCETVFPEKQTTDGFYKVRMDQIDPDAACLICLDNQWCPPEFYESANFLKEGFKTKQAVNLQSEFQEKEIFRALLHHRQIIVNRAYFYNSQVFDRFYCKTSGDYEAFQNLLSNGTMLVYLTEEDKPYDKRKRPKFGTTNYDLWGQICRDTEVFCLRMDWTDAVCNRRKVEQLLYKRFQSFCLTMAENQHQLNELADAFDLNERQKRAFGKVWHNVQLHAAERNRDKDLIYTRESFYKYFLIEPDTDVNDCILDIEKPFSSELKEIVDLQYGLNLPEALGVQAIYPPMGHLKDFFQSGRIMERDSRELTCEELSCAVGQFEPEFLKNSVDFPCVNELSLDEIVLLREMDEWKYYIRAVSNGRKRAHLQEVDFYDISYVWEHFYIWMSKARELTEDSNRIQWETIPGSVSVIYRLGSYEITTVYHADTKEIDVQSSLERIEDIPDGQNHTVLITIDYVCADLLAGSKQLKGISNHHGDGIGSKRGDFTLEQNFLLAELRLFEGMSKEPLSEVFTTLMERLNSMQARIVPSDREAILQKKKYESKKDSVDWREYVTNLQLDNHNIYTERRYRKEKERHVEWIWYMELMDQRPEDFRDDDDKTLTIVTDLNEICRYEREHLDEQVSIGVRYKSPYSMLVVDLVRDSSGREFTYERILPTIQRGAVVCVAIFNGRFVLLEQFRHSMRTFQLAFPRGYADENLSGEKNAEKELYEELGVSVLSTIFLGHIVADSGMNGNKVEVYVCETTQPQLHENYEGIHQVVLLTKEELRLKIANGEITDGYTLGAMEMMEASKGKGESTSGPL